MITNDIIRAIRGNTPKGPNVEQDNLLRKLNDQMGKETSKAEGLSFIPNGDIRIGSNK